MSKRNGKSYDMSKLNRMVDGEITGLRRWMVMLGGICAEHNCPIPRRVRAFLNWCDREFSGGSPGGSAGGVNTGDGG